MAQAPARDISESDSPRRPPQIGETDTHRPTHSSALSIQLDGLQ